MLCYVRLPDDSLLDIVLSSTARGQECLDKVCKRLCIIETDFFGLQYANKNGDKFWLNLRNPISIQCKHSKSFQLYFGIKFYVNPHLIQQDTTRHQFYLHIKHDLFYRRIVVEDLTKQYKLIALIAQIQYGDYSDQDSHLHLKLFYMRWIVALNSDLEPSDIDHNLFNIYNSSLNVSDSQIQLQQLLCTHSVHFQLVIKMHRQFQRILPAQATYQFLQEVAELNDIGTEYYEAFRKRGNLNEKYHIGVGVGGVTMKAATKNAIGKHIEYNNIVNLRTSLKCFSLKYIEDNGNIKVIVFRMPYKHRANALYRIITEKRTFYNFETVNESILKQKKSSWKNIFFSIVAYIFKKDYDKNKLYVFDIRKNFVQFHDDTQRVLFKLNNSFVDTSMECKMGQSFSMLQCNDSVGEDVSSDNDNDECQSKLIDKRLRCCICYERQTTTALIPCGHLNNCDECNIDCDHCLICRTPVEGKLKLYI